MSAYDPPNLNQSHVDETLADLEGIVFTDPSEAVTTATSAIDAVDTHGSVDERIRVRRILAMAYANTNQFEDALNACDAARNLPGAENAPIEFARIHLASMQPLAVLDRVDEAIAAGQSALHILESSDDDSPAGRIALNMGALNIGAIYAMTGRPGEALPYFDRAREWLEDEPVLLGQVETNRGTALAALDRFEEAETAFELAVAALNTDEQMSWAAAIAEGNLADLAARQGEINRSLRHFEASRRHLERDEAFGDLGRLNAEEASVLATSGLTAVARDAFAGAIALLKEHGTSGDLAMAQIAYGTALVDAGELTKASKLLTETSDLIDPDEHHNLYQQLLALRARLAIANHDHDAARTLIAQGIARVADRPVQNLRWTVMHANLARATGHMDQARIILETALVQAERSRITPLLAELHESLAKIARGQGDDNAADDHARQAIAASESVRGTIQADRIRQSWHQERLSVYGDLYLSLLGQSTEERQSEAFNVAERIRSRTLLDTMNARTDDVEQRSPQTEAERHLIEDRAGHRRWLNWMYSSLADGNEPTDEQLQELRTRERAAIQLDDRLATLRPHSGFDVPLARERVQEMMPESDVILSYLKVDDQYTVQIIDHDQAHGVANLASGAEIGDLVARLQFQLGRALAHGDRDISPRRQARVQRDTDTILIRLYDKLIAPLEPLMRGKNRVIVIPSGDLYSVPFSALLHDGTYLVDQLRVLDRARHQHPRWDDLRRAHNARPATASADCRRSG